MYMAPLYMLDVHSDLHGDRVKLHSASDLVGERDEYIRLPRNQELAMLQQGHQYETD